MGHPFENVSTGPEVDEALAQRIAGDTLIDVRTVRKALRGGPVRGNVKQRIEEALEALRPLTRAGK